MSLGGGDLSDSEILRCFKLKSIPGLLSPQAVHALQRQLSREREPKAALDLILASLRDYLERHEGV